MGFVHELLYDENVMCICMYTELIEIKIEKKRNIKLNHTNTVSWNQQKCHYMYKPI